MSATQPQQPQQPQDREVVFCHQCENEWYRDEHGLVCPECQGDFVEVIEANNDPREEAPDAGDFGAFAPDPSEDDIDNFEWRNNGPGQPPGGHYHGTMHRNITLQPGQAQGQGGQGIMGLIGQALGPALQGMLGGQQPQMGQERAPEQDGRPEGMPQAPPPGGGTTTRHGAGPGFSYTITTSTRSNFGPRDANQPQPFTNQPEHIDRMMAQMFMNIGAMPAQGHGHHHHHGGTFVFGGMPPGSPGQHGEGADAMPGGPMGFGNIFQLLGLGLPPGGVAGDHVYTQEGFDRIMTQLMQQHQAGNAPPPATEEAIDALPKRKITEKDFGDGGKADCSICMDEAELGSEVTELPCHHWFHFDCIKAWLKEHDTCPHCRQGITPKEGEQSTNRPRQPGEAPRHDMHSPEHQRSHVPDDSVPRAMSDMTGTRRHRFAAFMNRATQNMRTRSRASSGYEYRTYVWNDQGASFQVNHPINPVRTSADLPPVHGSAPRVSFREAVRSDICALARALGFRVRYSERHSPEGPAVASGPVLFSLLRGRNGGRIVVATFGLRSHNRVERRLSRRYGAGALAEVLRTGPLPSRHSPTDHDIQGELDTGLGRNPDHFFDPGERTVNAAYESDRYSERAFQTTISDRESETTPDVEQPLDPHLHSPALRQVDKVDFSHGAAGASTNRLFQRVLARRHHSWLRRHTMGGFPSADGSVVLDGR